MIPDRTFHIAREHANGAVDIIVLGRGEIRRIFTTGQREALHMGKVVEVDNIRYLDARLVVTAAFDKNR